MVLLCNITSFLFALISISSLLSIVKSDEDRGGYCTGSFWESGRPGPGTACASRCYYSSGRWGNSYCYTDSARTNWGAPCTTCPSSGAASSTAWFYITSELNSQVIAFRWHHANKDVVMWRKSGREAQLWRWDGNTLVTKQNGKALTIKNADKKKKATVWLMPKNGGKEQEWKLEDGRLVSGLNGLVLNIKNDDKSRGNTVWMWDKNQSKAQKWKLQLAAKVRTVNYCTGEPGCCTEKHQCKEREGGCEKHDHCKGGLLCGKDNCPWEGWHWDGANCCTQGSYKCKSSNPICQECTSKTPCARGFGDCDKDSECEGNLTCGNGNCPWKTPWWDTADDCCE